MLNVNRQRETENVFLYAVLLGSEMEIKMKVKSLDKSTHMFYIVTSSKNRAHTHHPYLPMHRIHKQLTSKSSFNGLVIIQTPLPYILIDH